MGFFFFWIIKNLLPKGEPKTTKKATKKNWQPKAARKNEKRTAPPLKTRDRGNSLQQETPD